MMMLNEEEYSHITHVVKWLDFFNCSSLMLTKELENFMAPKIGIFVRGRYNMGEI